MSNEAEVKVTPGKDLSGAPSWLLSFEAFSAGWLAGKS